MLLELPGRAIATTIVLAFDMAIRRCSLAEMGLSDESRHQVEQVFKSHFHLRVRIVAHGLIILVAQNRLRFELGRPSALRPFRDRRFPAWVVWVNLLKSLLFGFA